MRQRSSQCSVEVAQMGQKDKENWDSPNRQPLMRFTAIDFETANSDRGSVCAVGLVVVENGEVVGRMSHLIRPEPLVFDPFNVFIHGITEDDVADAPTFSEFWPSLWAKVSGPLVAHNAAFDMSVLRRALDHVGTPYPETDYFCTRVISKLVWPQHPTYALDHIAKAIGIRFKHHDAQEDARACALIALAACKQVNVASLHDLQDTFGLRVGRMFSTGYWPCGAAWSPRSNTSHRSKLRAADIIPTGAAQSEASPCCDMAFVFTGALCSMQRKDAMQAVVDRGGICHDTVKDDTDFLVLGQDGFIGYQEGHKSSKMRKAEEMRTKGLPIEIISEADFLGML
jgi:DNA polymerase III subunit epsilon